MRREISPLRERRLAKGLTQGELARLTGLSQTKISYAERGLNLLNKKQMWEVAKALRTKVRRIFPAAENTNTGTILTGTVAEGRTVNGE